MRLTTVPVIAAALLGGCQTTDEMPASALGQATLRTASGTPAGTVRMLGAGTDVALSVSLSGLPEGRYGVHLHPTASCEPTDFASAGAHLSDFPTAVIGASGAGTVSGLLPDSPEEVLAQIFDADGTALAIHAGVGSDRAGPAGASGSPIACGVLVQN
jgi:Cu-Zn family superoxide dismutase